MKLTLRAASRLEGSLRQGSAGGRWPGMAIRRLADEPLVRRIAKGWTAFGILLAGGTAGYVLIEYLRRVGLKATELARAQVTTIRTKLLKIGGRVRVSVRRIYLSLASGHPLQALFRRVARRLTREAAADPAPT